MKAILEIDAPESCIICPFCSPCGTSRHFVQKCYAIEEHDTIENPCSERAPFCPLEIVEPDGMVSRLTNMVAAKERRIESMQYVIDNLNKYIRELESGGER